MEKQGKPLERLILGLKKFNKIGRKRLEENKMQQNEIKKNPLAVDSIWKLLGKYAVPCVISLLVNSLYNMVDQIFIGQGVGYLGNGATNIIYPLTVIVLSIALMLGDGGASFLSIRLGEGNKKEGAKGIGSTITFSIVAGIFIALIMAVFIKTGLFIWVYRSTLSLRNGLWKDYYSWLAICTCRYSFYCHRTCRRKSGIFYDFTARRSCG